jgi:hypothetical protein
MLLKLINARFRSKCPETGRTISRGDATYYDVINKVAYHPSADIVRIFESRQVVADLNTERIVNAQEEAYFDNFCHQNNI